MLSRWYHGAILTTDIMLQTFSTYGGFPKCPHRDPEEGFTASVVGGDEGAQRPLLSPHYPPLYPHLRLGLRLLDFVLLAKSQSEVDNTHRRVREKSPFKLLEGNPSHPHP